MDIKLMLENQIAIMWALYDTHHNDDVRTELKRMIDKTSERVRNWEGPPTNVVDLIRCQ